MQYKDLIFVQYWIENAEGAITPKLVMEKDSRLIQNFDAGLSGIDIIHVLGIEVHNTTQMS